VSCLHCTLQRLATTLGGNVCPLLTVAAAEGSARRQRPVVFVSARVHPGESDSSWMMEGFLALLLHPTDPLAQRLPRGPRGRGGRPSILSVASIPLGKTTARNGQFWFAFFYPPVLLERQSGHLSHQSCDGPMAEGGNVP